MFALGSPRRGDLDLSRSVAMGLVGGRVICIGGRVGIELTFPGMLCESCVCEEGPRERGTGGSEGECLGIHGFSCSNHPSCSRRLFLVIEHHEYRCRLSCSVDMDCFPSSGACFLPNQFVWNLESRRTRLPATLRDLTCRTLTAWSQSLGICLHCRLSNPVQPSHDIPGPEHLSLTIVSIDRLYHSLAGK